MNRTTNIDLAAAYYVVTGQAPQICTEQQSDKLKSFEIPDNPTTQKLFSEYATGNLTLNVKKFAACRALLFRKIKGVAA